MPAIQHRVNDRLIIVSAGDAWGDESDLSQRLRERGLAAAGLDPAALLVLDLPPVLTADAGITLAGVVDALLVVARTGFTPTQAIADTCRVLGDAPVRGIVLNADATRIPRWLAAVL
jgi:hypothetical protein